MTKVKGGGSPGPASGLGSISTQKEVKELKQPIPDSKKEIPQSASNPQQQLQGARGHAGEVKGGQALHGTAKRTELAKSDFEQKSKKLDTTEKTLQSAKKEADQARADLKGFSGLEGQMRNLDHKIGVAERAAAKLQKENPEFVKSQRKMLGGTEPERDLADLKKMHGELKQKMDAGEGPLKAKVKQAEAKEKEALRGFMDDAKDLKKSIKEYAPFKKKEARSTAGKLEEEAGSLSKQVTTLHEKHPDVRVVPRSEQKMVSSRKYGEMHSSMKKETKILPSDVFKIHRTPQQEAEKVKDLKEADSLSDHAKTLGAKASVLRGEAHDWMKAELQELSAAKKKYKGDK